MLHHAFIAIGSNLGDRRRNCEHAITLLKATAGIVLEKLSSWYQTQALTNDGHEGPDYCNGTASLSTVLTPFQLLEQFQSIERSLGRSDRGKWQPRIIDLDLLLYDELELINPLLTVPHPEMEKRLFVLQPLCDIAPRVVHSRLGKSMEELLLSYRTQHPDESIRPWKNSGKKEGVR